MDRREALVAVSFIMGGTIIGAEAILSGCSPKKARVDGALISDKDINFLNEIAETIIPTTADSPGAKAAQVGEFIPGFVKDCYSQTEQDVLVNGISKLKETCESKTGHTFEELNEGERLNFLLDIERETAEYQKNKRSDDPAHYYTMLKQLIIFGYLTSEVGATKAMRHVAVPGRFEGCIPMEPGEKAWSA